MTPLEALLVGSLAALTAAVGAVGGLGGAILLVPALVLTGLDPGDAVPLGLLSVIAGSLAASGPLLDSGLVHLRLAVTVEATSAVGALGGALLGGAVGERTLLGLLGGAALTAALVGGTRRGVRNRPVPREEGDESGEVPGTLRGAYLLGDGIVRYRARRLPLGLVCMGGAGVLAGLTGASGGYLKTPVMSELMGVPVKVAAATTSLIVGVTAASALLVYAGQGRVDMALGGPVVLGALIGGRLGAAAGTRLPPVATRRMLAVVLVVVAALLLNQAVGSG